MGDSEIHVGYKMKGKIMGFPGRMIQKFKTVISNSKFLLAVMINVFFLLLVLLFCDMKYEVSDDFIMSTIMSGVYGECPNPHMIFVNIVLGYFLMPIFFLSIFPVTVCVTIFARFMETSFCFPFLSYMMDTFVPAFPLIALLSKSTSLNIFP